MISIQAINRNQMKSYIPDTLNIIAICIYSTGDKAPKLQDGWGRILPLQFDDVDTKYYPMGLIDKYKLTLFNEDHARRIIEFINKFKTDKIVINCDAGISRSVGVMCALEQIYNNNNIFNKYPLHNKHVANTIMKVWENKDEK